MNLATDFFDKLCRKHLKKHEKTVVIRAASGRPMAAFEELAPDKDMGADEWVYFQKDQNGVTDFVVELHEGGAITEIWSGKV